MCSYLLPKLPIRNISEINNLCYNQGFKCIICFTWMKMDWNWIELRFLLDLERSSPFSLRLNRLFKLCCKFRSHNKVIIHLFKSVFHCVRHVCSYFKYNQWQELFHFYVNSWYDNSIVLFYQASISSKFFHLLIRWNFTEFLEIHWSNVLSMYFLYFETFWNKYIL